MYISTHAYIHTTSIHVTTYTQKYTYANSTYVNINRIITLYVQVHSSLNRTTSRGIPAAPSSKPLPLLLPPVQSSSPGRGQQMGHLASKGNTESGSGRFPWQHLHFHRGNLRASPGGLERKTRPSGPGCGERSPGGTVPQPRRRGTAGTAPGPCRHSCLAQGQPLCRPGQPR